MKNIKVVIGGVFGDEGKGLMTDYFCSKEIKENDVLNVRFNASSQAGHTVVTKDGNRNVFSHFGAGSYNTNVTTYLSSFFLIQPIKFMMEYEELCNKGIFPKVIISKDSLVVLPYDALINIIIEESRGDKRHGSCGAGVFEAVVRSNIENVKITVETLKYEKIKLFNIIKEIRDTYYYNRLKELSIIELEEKYIDLFNSDSLIENFIEDIKKMLSIVTIAEFDFEVLNRYNYQVFEGAQGLLLDWDNEDYAPNLTASYTGLKNVVSLLNTQNDINSSEIEICYVTRSYFTRHGAGRFETEVMSKECLRYDLVEKTNKTNTWQGSFRYGYMDRSLLIKNIMKDLKYLEKLNNKPKITLAITHLDETKDNILLGVDKEESIEKFIENLNVLNLDAFYISRGETRETIYVFRDG